MLFKVNPYLKCFSRCFLQFLYKYTYIYIYIYTHTYIYILYTYNVLLKLFVLYDTHFNLLDDTDLKE